MSEVRLTELDAVVTELAYPIDRAEAVESLAGTTLQYADGSEPLADVVTRSGEETFLTPEDLEAEIFANAATEAVGEPGQSEGEG